MSFINYAVCEPGGRVLRWGMAPDEDVAQAQAAEGEIVIFPPAVPVTKVGEVLLADLEAGTLSVSNTAPSVNHIFDHDLGDWVDPRSLVDLQNAAWERIKAERDAAEFGGFVWEGKVFDSDQLSQGRITGAVQLSSLGPDFEIEWTLADNSAVRLNAAQMQAVGIALGRHVGEQHVRARLLREEIYAQGVTPDDLDALTFENEGQ